MDSVSSSSASGVEFGVLPRTPASNPSKNGKENSRSGSLHKRIYDSLRFRSRSFSRSSDNGSPSSRPARRRKSIVDLLNLSSRESQHTSCVQDQVQPTKSEVCTSEDHYANLFSDTPRKRTSLGNLLKPTNILGTITNKVSQKHKSASQDSIPASDDLINEHLPIDLPEQPLETRKIPIVKLDNLATSKPENDTASFSPKLWKGSDVDMKLFESRLDRILDCVVTKIPADNSGAADESSSLQALHEAGEQLKGAEYSSSPDPLGQLSIPGTQTKSVVRSCASDPDLASTGKPQVSINDEKRPRTPDSYLRLLLDSCESSSQPGRRLSTDSSLHLFEIIPDPSTEHLNKELKETPASDGGGEVEALSIQVTPASLVRSSRHQSNRTTLESCNEMDLVRQQFRDQRPVVTVREVSRSSTPSNLDPDFRQRQKERAQKYDLLGLNEKSHWTCAQEKVVQSIASTVARMTRNYYSSPEDHVPCSEVAEAIQRAPEHNFSQNPYDGFDVDSNETWHSVTVGRRLMREGDNIDDRESRPCGDLGMLLDSRVSTSLADFDDLSTGCASSLSDANPQEHLHLPAEEALNMEEILIDSQVLRSPLEPFFANRHTAKTDHPLALDDEINFCPEYENFVRRSYGFLIERPSILLEKEMILHTASPRIEDAQCQDQLSMSSSRSKGQIPEFIVRVQFPGTVNLLQHTECFPSIGDAISGLCNYKLGDLANFYVYNPASRTVHAHLIDSPVPNPADLKSQGLQLHWITQQASEKVTDKVEDKSLLESSHHPRRQPSRCDSAWKEIVLQEATFMDMPPSTGYGLGKRSTSYPSLSNYVKGDRAISATNSVFDDDFFLEEPSGQSSEQISVAGEYSASRSIREALREGDVITALEFEERVQATKTWAELARETRNIISVENETVNSSIYDQPQCSSDEDEVITEEVGDNLWQTSSPYLPSFDDPKVSQSDSQKSSPHQSSCLSLANDESHCNVDNDADEASDASEAPRGFEVSERTRLLDELYKLGSESLSVSESRQKDLKRDKLSQHSINSEFGNPLALSHTPEQGTVNQVNGKDIDGDRFSTEMVKTFEVMDQIRQASMSPEVIPDYPFESIRQCQTERTEESLGRHAEDPMRAVEVFYEDEHGECSLPTTQIASAQSGSAETTMLAQTACNDGLQINTSHKVELSDMKILAERDCHSPENFILDFGPEHDFSANRDIERVELQGNKITLADLNIRPIGKAARPNSLPSKEKSKVGALVNIFQDYGLIPEQTRGPLQISGVSPSFNRQSSRYRREPSGMSVHSETIRKVSATPSAVSRCTQSPVNRVATPNSVFDRPHSRISDIDTEASFHFGEVLMRTSKHEDDEKENTLTRDFDIYG